MEEEQHIDDKYMEYVELYKSMQDGLMIGDYTDKLQCIVCGKRGNRQISGRLIFINDYQFILMINNYRKQNGCNHNEKYGSQEQSNEDGLYWGHVNCLLWIQDVIEQSGKLVNLKQGYKNIITNICSYCQHDSASLQCSYQKQQNSSYQCRQKQYKYHLSCAVKANKGLLLRTKEYQCLSCIQHQQLDIKQICTLFDSYRLIYINENNTNKIIRYINSPVILRVGNKHLLVDGKNQTILSNYLLASQCESTVKQYDQNQKMEILKIKKDSSQSVIVELNGSIVECVDIGQLEKTINCSNIRQYLGLDNNYIREYLQFKIDKTMNLSSYDSYRLLNIKQLKQKLQQKIVQIDDICVNDDFYEEFEYQFQEYLDNLDQYKEEARVGVGQQDIQFMNYLQQNNQLNNHLKYVQIQQYLDKLQWMSLQIQQYQCKQQCQEQQQQQECHFRLVEYSVPSYVPTRKLSDNQPLQINIQDLQKEKELLQQSYNQIEEQMLNQDLQSQYSLIVRQYNQNQVVHKARLNKGYYQSSNQKKERTVELWDTLYVSISNIHNLGLFTSRKIKKGELVIEYVGEVVRNQVGDLREQKYQNMPHGDCYLFRLDPKFIIDATYKGGKAKYLNHSCEPNLASKIIENQKQKKIVMYALKNIEAMEELTFDYQFEIEKDKLHCNCGSRYCQGSMN